MDVLHGLALNLLVKLLLSAPAVQQPPPPPLVKTVMVEAPQPLRIPEWVTRNPADSFVGISGLCASIEEARQQALHSAIAQIIQNMGATYDLSYVSFLEGNAHHAEHELKEHLAFTARWFVSSVNENIKKTDIQETKGGHVCFVLVKYQPDKIERLRRLTIGPKAGARVLSISNGRVIFEVQENNGVEITLTDYEMELSVKNRHAGVITLFFFKVPEAESETARGLFDRKIVVKDNSKTVSVNFPLQEQNLKSILLGSEREVRITLRGYDEIGRPVTLPVQIF